MQSSKQTDMNRNDSVSKKNNLGKRFIAYGLDFYLCLLATAPIFTLIDYNNLDKYFNVVALGSAYLLIWIQEVIFHKTVFKKLFKLQICSSNESNISFFQITIRNLFRVLGPIDGVYAIFDKKNRRLGDVLGKTIVLEGMSTDTDEDFLSELKYKINILYKRALAFTIDYVILFFPLLPILINFEDKNAQFYTFLLVNVLITIEEMIFKKTIGKKIFKLEIKSSEDNNVELTKIQIFKRNITRVLIPFDYLIALVDKQERRIGDIFAKTVVIRKNN